MNDIGRPYVKRNEVPIEQRVFRHSRHHFPTLNIEGIKEKKKDETVCTFNLNEDYGHHEKLTVAALKAYDMKYGTTNIYVFVIDADQSNRVLHCRQFFATERSAMYDYILSALGDFDFDNKRENALTLKFKQLPVKPCFEIVGDEIRRLHDSKVVYVIPKDSEGIDDYTNLDDASFQDSKYDET
jgi:hypothetical protein